MDWVGDQWALDQSRQVLNFPETKSSISTLNTEIIDHMARSLTFRIKRKEFPGVPVKVDRKKLYGWTEIVALDEQDRPCRLVNTDETGVSIIPKGGTAMGILSGSGEWVDRTLLTPVKEDGTPAQLIESSYKQVIPLKEKVKVDRFLDYSITDFYELTDISEEIIQMIGEDIYTFPYTYLDSYETTPAFLMVSDGVLFMLLGYENRFEMQCLGDCERIDEDTDDFIEISDDDIDFSMF